VVARLSNRWHGPSFSKQCIRRNSSFNSTILKETLRSLNHLLAMMMADQKIKSSPPALPPREFDPESPSGSNSPLELH
jgi:hypothetical protein